MGKSATHLNPPAVLLDPCGLVCGSLVGLSAIFPGLFEVLLNPPGIRATHSGPSAISLDCAQVFGSRLGFECDPFGPSCDPLLVCPLSLWIRQGFVCDLLDSSATLCWDRPLYFWTHLRFACDLFGPICHLFGSVRGPPLGPVWDLRAILLGPSASILLPGSVLGAIGHVWDSCATLHDPFATFLGSPAILCDPSRSRVRLFWVRQRHSLRSGRGPKRPVWDSRYPCYYFVCDPFAFVWGPSAPFWELCATPLCSSAILRWARSRRFS